jgi:hypothetical protein
MRAEFRIGEYNYKPTCHFGEFFFPHLLMLSIFFSAVVFWLGEWKYQTIRQFGECLEKLICAPWLSHLLVRHIRGFMGNAVMGHNNQLPSDDTLVCIFQTNNSLVKCWPSKEYWFTILTASYWECYKEAERVCSTNIPWQSCNRRPLRAWQNIFQNKWPLLLERHETRSGRLRTKVSEVFCYQR